MGCEPVMNGTGYSWSTTLNEAPKPEDVKKEEEEATASGQQEGAQPTTATMDQQTAPMDEQVMPMNQQGVPMDQQGMGVGGAVPMDVQGQGGVVQAQVPNMNIFVGGVDRGVEETKGQR